METIVILSFLQVDGASSAEQFLIGLLIDRLGMHYMDPAFLLPPQTFTNNEQVDAEGELSALIERREERLYCLGVQRISVDALIALASTLSSSKN